MTDHAPTTLAKNLASYMLLGLRPVPHDFIQAVSLCLADAWQRGRDAGPGEVNPYRAPIVPDELSAFEHALSTGLARDHLPADIAVETRRQRAADVPVGTVRVILETR